MLTEKQIEAIAIVCHNANYSYCRSIVDFSQMPWPLALDWQKSSAIAGVKFHLDNPGAGPSGSHESWMKQKLEEGWAYGEEKNVEKKTHPCIVPYDQLPKEQQAKDYIFTEIVHTLSDLFEDGSISCNEVVNSSHSV